MYAIDLAKQLKCAIIILSVIDNPTIIDRPVTDNVHHIFNGFLPYRRSALKKDHI
jgi:hypothetical protein